MGVWVHERMKRLAEESSDKWRLADLMFNPGRTTHEFWVRRRLAVIVNRHWPGALPEFPDVPDGYSVVARPERIIDQIESLVSGPRGGRIVSISKRKLAVHRASR